MSTFFFAQFLPIIQASFPLGWGLRTPWKTMDLVSGKAFLCWFGCILIPPSINLPPSVHPRGIKTRCPSYLNWFFSMWRNSNSTLNPSSLGGAQLLLGNESELLPGKWTKLWYHSYRDPYQYHDLVTNHFQFSVRGQYSGISSWWSSKKHSKKITGALVRETSPLHNIRSTVLIF